MKFEKILEKHYAKLNELDHQIAAFILSHKAEISNLSIVELAEKSFTSKSSIFRFVQKLGFSGYSEFKYLIQWDNHNNQTSPVIPIEHVGQQLIHILNKTKQMDLPKLYDKIYNSKRIYLLSTGLSQQLQAQVLQRNFLKMGISMSLIPLDIGTHLTSAVIEKLEPEDLLIVFSFSGENHAMKEALAIPLLKKIPVISFTNTSQNWLSHHSVFNISTYSEDSDETHFTSSFIHNIIDFITFEFEQYLKEKMSARLK
ncbi:MurR/RpiR family transcriptional regulator [Paenibacillus macerans]|uniref:MurR/RpiR family transcriptional regulator n=1 Tax=Paenibacillus macerans TaxID=44252 RepID=UPI002432325E|nr:MurR/RpiR family transcriptional regulator [Paenibacillus macerans]MBS5914300.1 MurR/RpiR family transcriptional regulator [Paenibacillus macerans]MEC0137787.1 MurR/RpiR family transcriptional regulator [Paenibacillus macerans]